MSALLFEDLVERLESNEAGRRLTITPILDRQRQIGPGSVDLRLGTEFLEVVRQSNRSIDPVHPTPTAAAIADRRLYVPLGDEFVLHPGQFVLGSTLEFFVIPDDVFGQVLSRSSWGRLGLLVATAVAVQPGFRGVLTLELVNAGSVPIVLRPGLRVAQLQLWAADHPTDLPYRTHGKYRAPLGPESNHLETEDPELASLRAIADSLHARRQPTSQYTSVPNQSENATLANDGNGR